jgi:hypothetical protein
MMRVVNSIQCEDMILYGGGITMRMVLSRMKLWASPVIIIIGLAGWYSPASAAEVNSPTKATSQNKAPKGRLPAHYAKVVSEDQRQKIYTIQEEYRAKIEAARAQLNALLKEEKEKVSAVLTEEQKKIVEEFQSATKVKKVVEKTEVQKTDNSQSLEKTAEQKSDK